MIVEQPFLTPVWIEGREFYQVQRAYRFDCYGSKEEVPEGLIVDGASVPRPVWWFLPPDGLHRAAALGHDWNHKKKGVLANGRSITRAQADLLFYHMMIDAHVNEKRALVAYRVVRRFGEHSWKNPKNVPRILDLVQHAPSQRRLLPKFALTRHIYDEPAPTP